MLNDRAAAILTFLDGVSLRRPTADHCHLRRTCLGGSASCGASFKGMRKNALGPEGWRKLADDCAGKADAVADGLQALVEQELAALKTAWRRTYRKGSFMRISSRQCSVRERPSLGTDRLLFRLQ
jgi:homoserine kinase type II